MPSDGGVCRACGRRRHSGECWPFVPASDIHAATVANRDEQIDRLTRERDAARAECAAWRKWEQGSDYTCDSATDKAMLVHDTLCPAWHTPTTGGQGEGGKHEND